MSTHTSEEGHIPFHTPTISVIIPVYDGLEETKACFESLLAAENDIPCKIIAIYDDGPNSQVEAYLDELAHQGNIYLYKNETNLGFVQTVNRGFDIAQPDDVVILNSDTRVPPRWLRRLVAPAMRDKKIATITPFTSNGEICSFPNFTTMCDLPSDLSVDQLDDLFARHAPYCTFDLPTGVGFCMFVSRQSLDQVGPFNETLFGRGYGEENDFCQRAKKSGFRNVLVGNLYVYHEGGVSFGKEKEALVLNAIEQVERQHPGYNKSVQQHIQENPARALRYQLVLHYLAESKLTTTLLVSNELADEGRSEILSAIEQYSEQTNFLWLDIQSPDRGTLRFPPWASSCTLSFDLTSDSSLLFSILQSTNVDYIAILNEGQPHLFVDQCKQGLGAKFVCTPLDCQENTPSYQDAIEQIRREIPAERRRRRANTVSTTVPLAKLEYHFTRPDVPAQERRAFSDRLRQAIRHPHKAAQYALKKLFRRV
ncbi:MAG: glycosyltransferase family 2 protein [Pseudomonadota bacterium]